MLERNEVEYREEWNQGGGSGGGQEHPELIPPILQMVDEGKIALTPAVELSFLKKEDVVLVVGYEREKVLAAYPEYPHAVQEPQQGTGHAVQCAREALAGFDGSVLVCYGDMPLMRRATYESLIETHKREGNDCTLLSAVSDEELPYGRIVRKSDGSFSHIVEDKDCTPEEKAIRELNVGVYVFESRPLWEAIDQLRPNNAQGEYYLTDAPAYILSRGGRVGACPTCTAEEMLGVNTVEQLAQVEELVRRREGLK